MHIRKMYFFYGTECLNGRKKKVLLIYLKKVISENNRVTPV